MCSWGSPSLRARGLMLSSAERSVRMGARSLRTRRLILCTRQTGVCVSGCSRRAVRAWLAVLDHGLPFGLVAWPPCTLYSTLTNCQRSHITHMVYNEHVAVLHVCFMPAFQTARGQTDHARSFFSKPCRLAKPKLILTLHMIFKRSRSKNLSPAQIGCYTVAISHISKCSIEECD